MDEAMATAGDSSVRGAGGILRRVPVMFWVLAILLTVYVGLCTGKRDNRWDTDAWEHHRAIVALTAQLRNPGNPTLDSAEPSIRYSPYAVAQAVICRATGIDPYRMLSIAGVVNTALLAFAVLALLAAFGEEKAAAWALLVMVGLYGVSPGYANSYALADLPWQQVNPSAWAFDLVLLSWALFKRRTDGGGWWIWPVIGVLLTIALLDHAMTGLFGFLGLMVMALTPPQQRWKLAGGVMLLGVVSVALCSRWPWYDFIRAARLHQDNAYWFNGAILRVMLTHWSAAALLGALAALTQIKRDLVRTFLLGAAATFTLGILALATRSAILARLPMPGMIFLQLPIAIFLSRSGVLSAERWREKFQELKNGGAQAAEAILPCMVIAVLGWCLAPQFYDVLDKPYLARSYVQAILHKENKQLDLRAKLGPILAPVRGHEVVLSDVVTSWPVPSFAGRIVAPLHYEFFVAGQPQRVRDVEIFFAADTSLSQRQELLRKYNVRWILLNQDFLDAGSFRQLLDPAAVTRSTGALVLMDAAVWSQDHLAATGP